MNLRLILICHLPQFLLFTLTFYFLYFYVSVPRFIRPCTSGTATRLTSKCDITINNSYTENNRLMTADAQDIIAMSQIPSPLPPEHPLSRTLWNFPSQWFLIPQGTGIVGLILYRLDYQFNGLHTLAKIVWIYTIVLLGLVLFLYILRILVYPRHVCQQLRISLIETSCLSSISIAITSILQLASLTYGGHAGLPIYILWWFNTALSVIACLGIPYIQLMFQPPEIHSNFLPPSILLPFIAALTSAAGGGTICRTADISPRLQVPALIVSYLEVGMGLALAAAVYTLILYQHLHHIHPPPDKVYQDMILCGPFGQGSFALQILGEAVVKRQFRQV